MVGRSSQPSALRYLGAVVAIAAVVGTVALGWEWGSTDDVVPLLLGGVCVLLAVGWTVYSRVF